MCDVPDHETPESCRTFNELRSEIRRFEKLVNEASKAVDNLETEIAVQQKESNDNAETIEELQEELNRWKALLEHRKKTLLFLEGVNREGRDEEGRYRRCGSTKTKNESPCEHPKALTDWKWRECEKHYIVSEQIRDYALTDKNEVVFADSIGEHSTPYLCPFCGIAMEFMEKSGFVHPRPSDCNDKYAEDKKYKIISTDGNRDDRNLKKLQIEINGYLIQHVQSAEFFDEKINEKNIGKHSANNKFDLIVNGTFCSGSNSLGARVEGYKQIITGDPRCINRGAIAILRDGTIMIGRARGNIKTQTTTIKDRLREIQARFGQEDNPVKSFMGGGALLIENGIPVTSFDLFDSQIFQNPPHSKPKNKEEEKENKAFFANRDGINSAQHRTTNHTLFGIMNGRLYVIIAYGKNGEKLQNDLKDFQTVVKFDGGGSGYAFKKEGGKWDNKWKVDQRFDNPTGVAIELSK